MSNCPSNAEPNCRRLTFLTASDAAAPLRTTRSATWPRSLAFLGMNHGRRRKAAGPLVQDVSQLDFPPTTELCAVAVAVPTGIRKELVGLASPLRAAAHAQGPRAHLSTPARVASWAASPQVQ